MAVKRPAPPGPLPEPTPATPPSSIEGRVKDILAVPKTGGSIPTLTCIDKGIYKRYFILDVDGEAYQRAWDAYRANGGTSPEEFVQMVLRILSQDMPRMHRAVSYVPLV